jgi:hypothetical protein
VEIVETLRALMDRVAWIEPLEESPDAGGLVLWSPASLRVTLHGG